MVIIQSNGKRGDDPHNKPSSARNDHLESQTGRGVPGPSYVVGSPLCLTISPSPHHASLATPIILVSRPASRIPDWSERSGAPVHGRTTHDGAMLPRGWGARGNQQATQFRTNKMRIMSRIPDVRKSIRCLCQCRLHRVCVIMLC